MNKKNYPYTKDHLEAYNDIDLALDTFPYNGVATTFEALWKGVPVNVLKGFNFNSRCGYSIIKNSTFENLISENVDEYVEKAVELANLDEKKMIKMKKYYSNNAKKYLYENKNFIREFEKTLLEISNLNK